MTEKSRVLDTESLDEELFVSEQAEKDVLIDLFKVKYAGSQG